MRVFVDAPILLSISKRRNIPISPDTPSSFFVLHWLTFFNALTAIVLLLLSRGHYTLDVIIAYFIATRAW